MTKHSLWSETMNPSFGSVRNRLSLLSASRKLSLESIMMKPSLSCPVASTSAYEGCPEPRRNFMAGQCVGRLSMKKRLALDVGWLYMYMVANTASTIRTIVKRMPMSKPVCICSSDCFSKMPISPSSVKRLVDRFVMNKSVPVTLPVSEEADVVDVVVVREAAVSPVFPGGVLLTRDCFLSQLWVFISLKQPLSTQS